MPRLPLWGCCRLRHVRPANCSCHRGWAAAYPAFHVPAALIAQIYSRQKPTWTSSSVGTGAVAEPGLQRGSLCAWHPLLALIDFLAMKHDPLVSPVSRLVAVSSSSFSPSPPPWPLALAAIPLLRSSSRPYGLRDLLASPSLALSRIACATTLIHQTPGPRFIPIPLSTPK